MTERVEDFTEHDPIPSAPPPKAPAAYVTQPWDPNPERETTRGDLARGLLWLLTFAIGGVLAFVGLGLLEGSVLTQSIFPSLIALTGTALGFYFGSQTAQASSADGGQQNRKPDTLTPIGATQPAATDVTQPAATGAGKTGE